SRAALGQADVGGIGRQGRSVNVGSRRRVRVHGAHCRRGLIRAAQVLLRHLPLLLLRWVVIKNTRGVLQSCSILSKLRNVSNMMGAPDAPPPPSTVPVAARAAVYALVVLTILNFVNYVDRYVLAAVLKPLHQDPAFRAVSDAQLGLLQTSFLVVYMIFSPIGGALGQRIKRKYIVAAGVGIWSLATLCSGAARRYGELLAARALIGFGAARYRAVAPALISDLFARDRRARMLSVFYVATPVGSALGFVLGGFVAQHWDWRHAFWVAGVPGLAFALLALFMAEPIRGVQDEPEPAPTA